MFMVYRTGLVPTFLCFRYDDPMRSSDIVAAAVRNAAITLNELEPELYGDLLLPSHVDEGPEDLISSTSIQSTMQAIIANYYTSDCNLMTYYISCNSTLLLTNCYCSTE